MIHRRGGVPEAAVHVRHQVVDVLFSLRHTLMECGIPLYERLFGCTDQFVHDLLQLLYLRIAYVKSKTCEGVRFVDETAVEPLYGVWEFRNVSFSRLVHPIQRTHEFFEFGAGLVGWRKASSLSRSHGS